MESRDQIFLAITRQDKRFGLSTKRNGKTDKYAFYRHTSLPETSLTELEKQL